MRFLSLLLYLLHVCWGLNPDICSVKQLERFCCSVWRCRVWWHHPASSNIQHAQQALLQPHACSLRRHRDAATFRTDRKSRNTSSSTRVWGKGAPWFYWVHLHPSRIIVLSVHGCGDRLGCLFAWIYFYLRITPAFADHIWHHAKMAYRNYILSSRNYIFYPFALQQTGPRCSSERPWMLNISWKRKVRLRRRVGDLLKMEWNWKWNAV